MGFGQGLSGLNAASQNLDVIGNNIANSSTVGFKASTIAFADVYASSRVGLGVQVAGINQRFTSGNISTSGNQFDMAIDGAKGLFRLVDNSGAVYYSRNGQFTANKDFDIVNAQGQKLTGFKANPDGTITNELTTIKVPVGNIAPQATTESTIKANFDSRKPVISTGSTFRDSVGTVLLTDAAGDTSEHRYTVNAAAEVVWMAPAPADDTYTLSDGSTTLAVGPTSIAAATMPDGDGNVQASYEAVNGRVYLTDATGTTAAYEYTDLNGIFAWVNAPADATYTLANGQTIQVAAGVPSAYPFPEVGGNTPYVPAGQELVAFDPTRPDNYTHTLPMTVYDSLGNPHQLNQYFVKTESSATHSRWEVFYYLNGEQVGQNNLVFDEAGRLDPAGQETTLTIPDLGLGQSPAEDLVIRLDYSGSTQFGGEFSPSFTQNGFTTGEYSSMSIANDGTIVANYTNGESKIMGAVALADFNNMNGLQPVGGNAWVETGASGQPVLGQPGTNGFAGIKGQSVEESNVDMSQELVNMIIAQRTYQANAQTIKTQDQILQTLITLR